MADRSEDRKHRGRWTVPFTDNRAEASQLKMLQRMVDNGPHAANAARLQAMANIRPGPSRINGVAQMFRNEQYAAIHRQLNGFYNKWTPEGVAADIPAAHADLVARLATVGIVYGDGQGSRGRNDQVNGLWIGEILDMVNTLCMFLKDATGFLPKKFWSKLKTMTTIMGEDD